MTREEFKTEPQAQKRFYIFIGAVVLAVLWLMFGGTARNAVRGMSVRKAAPSQARAQAPPLRVAPVAPVATAPAVNASALSSSGIFAGSWAGHSMTEKQGMCTLTLEIRQEADGAFTAYHQMSCFNSPTFTGQKVDPKTFNPALMMLSVKPASAILKGSPSSGAIAFKVDKVTNTNAMGCIISALTLTPFGTNQMAAEWSDSCGGGNIMLTKGGR